MVPRPLSSREPTALDALLRGEFDGSEELRLQAGSVLAEGDGLIIDLVVDERLPEARSAIVPPSRRVFMTVTRWVASFSSSMGGRLSALEYWWTSDQKPRQFPRASAIGDPVVT